MPNITLSSYHELFAQKAQFFEALAHPKRLEIISLLSRGSLCVSEIQSMLGMAQANLSQHLSMLRKANIVSTKKNGKEVEYSLIDRDAFALLNTKAQNAKDIFPIVIDPVCKMRLTQQEIAERVVIQDREYCFCASGCKQLFEKNKEQYVTHCE